jgi:hypothetical protein
MEENPQRALAYALAKSIDIDTLNHVSGGSSSVSGQWSSRETLVASGFGGQNVDGVIDISIDI